MRFILEIISGPFKGKRVEAKVGQTIRVGRTSKSDVAMEDNFMSGEHFAIECDSRSCRVRDLKSRNGTKLNGELITEAILKDGDKIYAGRTDFIVRIKRSSKPVGQVAEQRGVKPARSTPPSAPQKTQTHSDQAPRRPMAPVTEPFEQPPAPSQKPKPTVEKRQSTSSDVLKHGVPEPPTRPVSTPAPPIQTRPEPAVQSKPRTPEPIAPEALDAYQAATPEGRLFHILSNQFQPLMALIDAAHDPKVLELLRGAREDFQSLYRGEQKAAPYLVTLPARSEMLKQMIQQGWGKKWGVYLSCPLPLPELREYFRTSLMVTMPDGMELFSRFYDPRFFRGFLETCTAVEAEKFFGPITAYLMEDERREILLEFRRSKTGAEKKGHLLSVLS